MMKLETRSSLAQTYRRLPPRPAGVFHFPGADCVIRTLLVEVYRVVESSRMNQKCEAWLVFRLKFHNEKDDKKKRTVGNRNIFRNGTKIDNI